MLGRTAASFSATRSVRRCGLLDRNREDAQFSSNVSRAKSSAGSIKFGMVLAGGHNISPAMILGVRKDLLPKFAIICKQAVEAVRQRTLTPLTSPSSPKSAKSDFRKPCLIRGTILSWRIWRSVPVRSLNSTLAGAFFDPLPVQLRGREGSLVAGIGDFVSQLRS